MSGDKLDLYATDTYFLESWEDLHTVRDQVRLPSISRLAALTLKPDAIVGRMLLPTIAWLAENDFVIVAAERFEFDRHLIRGIWQYSWNAASRGRKELVDLLLSATPSLFLALRGPEEASLWLSRNKGPANPDDRRPGQLRSHLGAFSTLLNFVHTSDEPADFIRELGVYFPASRRRRIYRSMGLGSSTSEAVQLARQLETEYAAHDLSQRASVERIRAACTSADDAEEGNHAGLIRLLAEIEGGSRPDWRLLSRLCQESGFTPDPWDLLTVATYLVGGDECDLEPVVPGVSTMSPPAPTEAKI
jgi:nucleoside diphosphate kinase